MGLAEQKRHLSARGSLLALLHCLVLVGCASGPETLWKSPRSDPDGESVQPAASQASKNQSPNVDTGKAQGKKPVQAAVQYSRDLGTAADAEKQGDLTEARTTYERLISQYPDRYEAYHRLAVVADRQRRYQEAQSLYTQAIRRNNRDPDLFNDLGYCFYLQGKMDKAESAILKAVAMRPAEPRYRNNLGLVYGQQRRYEEALAQYRRAGGEGDAYYNLAFIKASQEDFEGAKDCFRHALAADPTHEKARRALASFESAQNDPEKLRNMGAMADDATNWIPYLENGSNHTETAQTGTAGTSTGANHGAATQRSATQGLIDQAQSRAALSSQAMAR
jgi:tetratricopeptide (TPR) repeat protein